ncbi:hypothetical protein V6N11_084351 [Hibiscus sabdariffa]|uniref:Transmembrane protein n=1 Tax=Hibiscus sabdariffa TaxID=183260 RepID=A0ABR2QST7_9ROSI
MGCDGVSLYLYGVLWPAIGVGLDLTSLARLWLEYCMLFWELRLRFVQHRIALLPDAPNVVVSIGVVCLLPCTIGHDGVVSHACSIARLTTAVHVHWLAFGVGFGLTIWSKRSASRPRGCVSLVEDDADASVPDPTATPSSPSEGLPTEVTFADAPRPASNSVAAFLAPANRLVSSAPTSSVQATTVTKDIPHDPMVHTDNSDMVEEAIEDASLDPENSETATARLASEDVPYDPMVHNDTSDMMEEALEISSD